MTAWGRKAAPATAALNKSEAAVERAADSEDVPAARSALERAGRDAVRMESTPIPQCVDPGGYYRKWLDRWTAAGDNARSRGGLKGLNLAEASLSGSQNLRHKLDGELKTAGYSAM